jgi:hypothetical protein
MYVVYGWMEKQQGKKVAKVAKKRTNRGRTPQKKAAASSSGCHNYGLFFHGAKRGTTDTQMSPPFSFGWEPGVCPSLIKNTFVTLVYMLTHTKERRRHTLAKRDRPRRETRSGFSWPPLLLVPLPHRSIHLSEVSQGK